LEGSSSFSLAFTLDGCGTPSACVPHATHVRIAQALRQLAGQDAASQSQSQPASYMRFVWRCSGRNARSGGDASAPPRKRTDPAETKHRPRGYPSRGDVDLSRPYRFTANAGEGHPPPRVFEERLSQRHFTMMPQVNAVLSGRQRTGSGKCRFVWLALQAEALVASWRPCPAASCSPPLCPWPSLSSPPAGAGSQRPAAPPVREPRPAPCASPWTRCTS